MIRLLSENVELYFYSAAYMLEIDSEIISHELSMVEPMKPMKHKKINVKLQKDKIIAGNLL